MRPTIALLCIICESDWEVKVHRFRFDNLPHLQYPRVERHFDRQIADQFRSRALSRLSANCVENRGVVPTLTPDQDPVVVWRTSCGSSGMQGGSSKQKGNER